MKTINVPIGDSTYSMVSPPNAAAWALVMSNNKDKAMIVFRMKKTSENSSLTSLRQAKEELPGLEWRATGANPWGETAGGVAEKDPLYQPLYLTRSKKGDWAVRYETGMDQWANSGRDLAGSTAALPRDMGFTDKESLLKAMSAYVTLGKELLAKKS